MEDVDFAGRPVGSTFNWVRIIPTTYWYADSKDRRYSSNIRKSLSLKVPSLSLSPSLSICVLLKTMMH